MNDDVKRYRDAAAWFLLSNTQLRAENDRLRRKSAFYGLILILVGLALISTLPLGVKLCAN